MPNGVFGAPPLPPPPPPIPTVAQIYCATITQKGAAVASAQQCFFKAVEWGVVGAQRGLAVTPHEMHRSFVGHKRPAHAGGGLQRGRNHPHEVHQCL